MSTVTLRNLVKSYGKVIPVNNVSLDVADGEFIALLGSSGCGKTTTLRLVAGLLQQDSGDVFIDNESMTNVAPWHRNIGFVFQNYALFPHLNVYKNIAYGLNIRKWDKDKTKKQVHRVAELAEIEGLLERYPRQLSGGQQQRVALARALAIDPKVLLLDEPLSGLDAKLRERMQYELRAMQRAAKITSIYVTHDQNEAFALADRVIIMDDGVILQIGTPSEIYNDPQKKFVAQFIGTSNSTLGRVENISDSEQLVDIRCNDTIFRAKLKNTVTIGQEVTVVIRTNRILINHGDSSHAGFTNKFTGKLLNTTLSGSFWKLNVSVGGIEMRVDVSNSEEGSQSQFDKKDLDILIDADNIWYFID